MQNIQEKYGTIAKWGELTDGSNGEPNAKAVIFGFAEVSKLLGNKYLNNLHLIENS